MRKLTKILFGAMLFFGIGTAFADEVPAPTFDPVDGSVVEANSTVTVVYDGPENEGSMLYDVLYIVDNPTFDFSQYDNYDDVPYSMVYENPITITQNMTITAITVEYDMESYDINGWSEKVSASYTVKEVEPIPGGVPAPVFKVDGNTVENATMSVAEGTKVMLTNGTESDETPKPIYYNIKVTGSEEFNNVKTQAQLTSALTSISMKLIVYPSVGIEITKATPINAATADIDEEGNVTWSTVITKNFTIGTENPNPSEKPEAPTFDPDGGEVDADQEITITSATTSAKIYYANNDNFLQYTTQDELDEAINNDIGYGDAPILYESYDKPTAGDWNDPAGSTVSISAAAVMVAADGKLTWSDATTKQFTIKEEELPEGAVATPVIDPGSDAQVRMGTKVTIECATEDAEIYYTTDGTAPYTLDDKGDIAGINESAIKYTEPFALEQSMLIAEGREYSLRIRAIATKDGQFSMGAAAGYVVYPNKPTFSPAAGPVLEGTKVEIKCVPTFSDIYYTTDGSTPTMENSPKYTEPIEITEAMTIKAIAVLGQYQESASASYTIGEPIEPLTLTFDPASGSEVEEGTEVVVTPSRELGEDEVLFFAMFATKEAAEACTDEEMLNEAKFYGEPDPEDETIGYPVITKAAPVLKIGFISGEDEDEEYIFTWMYAEYTIKEEPIVEEKDTLPMPKFSLVAGEVTKGITVTLSCDTADAKIYYSINADTVTVNSLEYTAAIAIDSNMSIRAIAVKEGFENSPVAVAAYTVKEEETANEGAELAGVRVYPNPNAGTFSVDVPERARVEIFGLNGALLMSREVNAGVAAFNLDHSGIYFVRVMAGNKTAVKRVIVR